MKKVDGISENENGDEWRRNWREYLKHISNHHNGHDVCQMLNMNLQSGELGGVLKRGDEVIEVRNENENEVELMIVNVKNHSMRVLRGSEGEELVEVDLSELKENEIIDLNEEGRRWEGGVLKGEVFGYGCLYDEDNGLEYEGWIIDGVKRCYGIEYWSDIGIVKYDGCYYNGKKQGYGLLFNRKGDIEHEVLLKNDCIIDTDRRLNWNDPSDLYIDSHIDSLITSSNFNPDISCLLWNWPLISLKRIEIGDNCFENVNRFVLDGLNELESVKIGKESFSLSEDRRKGSKCLIMNCDGLREVEIGDWSFLYYEVIELKNLPSLSIFKGDGFNFRYIGKVSIESMNDDTIRYRYS